MGGAFDKAKQTAKEKASEYLGQDQQDQQDREDQEGRSAKEGAEGRQGMETGAAEQKGGAVPPQSRREDQGEPGEEGWAHTEEGSGYRPEHEHHHGSKKE